MVGGGDHEGCFDKHPPLPPGQSKEQGRPVSVSC